MIDIKRRIAEKPEKSKHTFNYTMMRKKLFITLVFLSSMMVSQAEPYGRITVTNCYQYFTTALAGGSYNVMGGGTIFGTTNYLDFSSVNLFEVVGGVPVYTGTVPCGVSTWLNTGSQYIVAPVLAPGTFYPGGPVNLNIVTPVLAVSDYNHDGCMLFGDPFELSLSPVLDGFCGYFDHSFIGPTGIVHTNEGGIPDDGYCTPPPGVSWIREHRCYDITINATISPCNIIPNCPPLTLQNTVKVCCNSCNEYTDSIIPKSFTGEEMALSIYPNPSSDKIQVQSMYTGIVEIYNTIGQQVSIFSIEKNGKISMDVSAWPQGPYIYRFISPGNKTMTGKLIVSH